VVVKRLLVGCLAALGLALADRPASGQTIRGSVLDADTNAGIPQVLIEVIRRGEVVARALTDSIGRYQVTLASRRADTYNLRASRLGYAAQDFDPVEVSFLESVELTLRLSSAPIPLQGIMVEAGRVNLRHAATYEGLYARRERALPVGQERIVVRGDPEMKSVSRVEHVMQQFFFGMTRSRGTRCVDYYINGLPRTGFDVLNIPVSLIEGIEYHVDGRFAPHGFFGGPSSTDPNCFRYSIVAVWFRRDGS
jgi:hypothetical protein